MDVTGFGNEIFLVTRTRTGREIENGVIEDDESCCQFWPWIESAGLSIHGGCSIVVIKFFGG